MGAGPKLGRADREALDGLRGIAALIVVASHASNLGLHLVPGWSLAGIGKSGVFLFFVLSAFLLTWQWLVAEPVRLRQPGWVLGYALRRVARIYPLYTVVLLAGWALTPRGLGVPMDGEAVWTHLTLREGRDIYWSIPVEFLYYLCIPPLALALHAVRHRWLAGAALLTAAMVLVLVAWPAGDAPLNSIVLGYYLPIFLAGSAAAWGLTRGVPRPWPQRRTRWYMALDLAMLLALLGTVPSVAATIGGQVTVDFTHRAFLAWGVFWALLLAGVLMGLLPAWRACLRWSALQACGRWCFGIYLLHMPALLLLNRAPAELPTAVKGWLALLLAVLLAALAHRVVESPAIRWAARRGRPAAPPLAPAR